MEEIINVKIENTKLGYEDHGIMTCWLHLTWPSSGQGFGGYALDEFVRDDARKWSGRIPTAILGKWVKGIIDTVGVESWEDLKGKYIRIKKDGFNSPIIAIGNLLEDKWFDPKSP